VTIRRLSVLQWSGLLGGGTIWFTEFLAGVGTSEAACNPAGRRWGVPLDTVQLGLMAFALAAVAAAGLASLAVFRATRNVDEEDPPPEGRLHFFATAALLGNAVFFMIILLTGIATTIDRACHQA
jgi:hypothetical protein